MTTFLTAGGHPGGTATPSPALPRRERHGLAVAAAALAAALLAWVPALAWLAYPFRLLTTLVHELSHGFAALATGGRFLRFVVFADGSGLAYTAGGLRLLVIPAGYLGAAVFGALLLLAAGSPRAGRRTLGLVGAVLVAATLRYSLPTLWSGEALAGLLTLAAGLGLGAALLALAIRASHGTLVFTAHLLAFQAAWTAFTDLWTVIGLSTSQTTTDAAAMAALTFVPAPVWAVLWAATAAVLVGAAARRVWRRWDEPPPV